MKPYIDAIVEEINVSLTEGFAAQRKLISGIVKQLPYEEGEVSLLIDSAGNRFAGVDDRYDVVLWHRADQTSFEVQEQTFGEGIDDYNAITEITLYAYGNQSTGINERKLVEKITRAMPSVVNIENQNAMGIGSNAIELLTANYNSIEVFNQIYEGQQYNLKASDTLVSLTYRITSEINKSCFDRCFSC